MKKLFASAVIIEEPRARRPHLAVAYVKVNMPKLNRFGVIRRQANKQCLL